MRSGPTSGLEYAARILPRRFEERLSGQLSGRLRRGRHPSPTTDLHGNSTRDRASAPAEPPLRAASDSDNSGAWIPEHLRYSGDVAPVSRGHGGRGSAI